MMYKVLYIEGAGDIIGGGQISLLKLLQNIDQTVIKSILICPFKGELASHAEKLGIPFKNLPMDSPKKRLQGFISSLLKLRGLIRDMEVDIVHCNTSRSVLYGGLAARPLGVPVIWHVRVIGSEGWYDKFLAGLCHRLFVVSKAVEARFNWLLKNHPNKITLIHNGVDLQEFNQAVSGDNIRREFDLPPDIPIAGVVGNLIVWKGQKYFIKAASQVLKTVPAAKFFIVGEGECRPDLERLSEDLGIRNKLIFTGRRLDIPQLMAAMDVVVHSSISPEPFARVILEAMAIGKPIVAMNEGGAPEAIEDGVSGILIPPMDASLMATAITSLMIDMNRAKQIGEAARRRIEENFSIRVNVRKTQNEYAWILRERSRAEQP